ncbi:MAG: YwiC-like family protein [Deltaproteobacteria bacterium]|nr:YwiC-like family protein [Deltaproteobacteria bacterium]
MTGPTPPRTSGEKSPWRDLAPREHGLWAWLVLPLVLALALTPTWAALAAGLATVAGFAGLQGWGRVVRGSAGARTPTLVALGLAAALGLVAALVAARPAVLVATLGLGAAAGFVAMTAWRGRAPREIVTEVGAIVALGLVGALVAIGAGAPLDRAGVAALALGAWLVAGLWWVKGQLARVLSNREPWVGGFPVVAALVAASIAAGVLTGHPVVGLVPLLYGARMQLHAAPAHARDARRVGLTELAWGLGAVALIALAAHFT